LARLDYSSKRLQISMKFNSLEKYYPE